MCSPFFRSFEIKVRQYCHFFLWCPHGGYSYAALFSDEMCLSVSLCLCTISKCLHACHLLLSCSFSFMHLFFSWSIFPHLASTGGHFPTCASWFVGYTCPPLGFQWEVCFIQCSVAKLCYMMLFCVKGFSIQFLQTWQLWSGALPGRTGVTQRGNYSTEREVRHGEMYGKSDK